MVTVFTSTYNRASLLPRLFNSLKNQTNQDFEWIIINDGSTDTTADYIKTIVEMKNAFPIKYYEQENGGKHRAINQGVKLAEGDMFFIVDSDDCLTSDAIEKINKWKLSLDNSKKYAGVAGARGSFNGGTIGQSFAGTEFIDAKNNERRELNLLGDKAEAYFTEVLKQYPFPEFDGENFITEDAVWDRIAIDGYYIRWHQDVIYLCDYLDDGLTKNIKDKWRKNPQGVLYYEKNRLIAYSSLSEKMRSIYGYYSALSNRFLSLRSCIAVSRELRVNVIFVMLSVMCGGMVNTLRNNAK